MKVDLDEGLIYVIATQTLTEVAAQSTGTITAPTTNPRHDIVYIDQATGIVGVATGTEAASPVDPAIPSGNVPVARISLETTDTDIKNGMIDDLRVLNALGLGDPALLTLGDGLTSSGDSMLVDLATDPGLEFISGELRAMVSTGITRVTAGLELDINGLTEESTGDPAADFLAIYDTSASALRKIKPDNLGIGNGGGGCCTLLASATPSSAASVDFTSGIDSTYEHYQIRFTLKPATDVVQLYLRVSTDAGSTWKSGSSDYSQAGRIRADNATAPTISSTGFTKSQIEFTTSGGTLGSQSGEGVFGVIDLWSPANTSFRTAVSWHAALSGSDSGRAWDSVGTGVYTATTAVDGIQLLTSSGNISEGWAALYGISKS